MPTLASSKECLERQAQVVKTAYSNVLSLNVMYCGHIQQCSNSSDDNNYQPTGYLYKQRSQMSWALVVVGSVNVYKAIDEVIVKKQKSLLHA